VLQLDDKEFVVFCGEKEYVVPIPQGDVQIDYTVLADGPCAIYVAFGEKSVPLDVGHKLMGRLLVADVRWMMVKPEKKTTMVAIRVLHRERHLSDKNDGLSAVVQVPDREPYDVRAMVRRLVGQELDDARGRTYDGPELDELVPDDVDPEFGMGHVQLEEDDELEEILHDARARARAARSGKGRAGEGQGGEGGNIGGEPPPPANGREPAERPPATAKS